MLRSEVALDLYDIYLATGNQDDEILHSCQRYWIAEAIRYTHREAVEELFTDYNCWMWWLNRRVTLWFMVRQRWLGNEVQSVFRAFSGQSPI
jgi:hypothetical protein